MSYGQPWRRTTAGPLASPASAYPTFSRPASICRIGPKDVFVPGNCALAESIAPKAMAALRRNRQRLLVPASSMLRFPYVIRSLRCDHVVLHLDVAAGC